MRMSVSAVVIWFWSFREVLENCQFSIYVGIPKKWFLVSVKKCVRFRTKELASESEAKLAKSKSSILPCPFMEAAVIRFGPDLQYIFYLK